VLVEGGLLIFDALNRHSYKPPLKRLRYRATIRSRSGFSDKFVDVLSWSETEEALAGAAFKIQAASGYGWLPFTVNSTTRLVEAAAWAEKLLQLDRLPGISPRILVAARRQMNI
jgi:hypothetical protein